MEPDAALEEGLARTESLGSYRVGGGEWEADERPTESHTAPRRGPLHRSTYGSVSDEGRGLLMLHEVTVSFGLHYVQSVPLFLFRCSCMSWGLPEGRRPS